MATTANLQAPRPLSVQRAGTQRPLALGQMRASRNGTLSHTGKEKAMRRSSFQGLVVGGAVLGLLVLGGARLGSAVTVSDGCTDAGGHARHRHAHGDL
jgi:hypothetical protein